MAIATTCPNCKALFRLADEMAGKKVKCQKCAQVFTVATADAKADPDASVKRAIDMEIDAPKVAPAPPADDAPPDSAVTADDEPAVPSSKKAPPPPVGKKSKESPSRARRAPSDSGSSATLIAILIVVIGGGLFACAGACGIGGWLYYASEDKPAKAADPAPLAANNDGANKDVGNPKGGKKGGGMPTVPPPLPPPPGPKGKGPAAAAATVTLAGDGTFRSDNVLNQTDARDPMFKYYKAYTIQMTAGKYYQIDMVSDLNNGGFDSYLILFDDQNQILARDDDGGGYPNARILFQAKKAGNYRIHATHFGGEAQGNFMLFVRQSDKFGVIPPPQLKR